ncbi:MAG: hypothetical protein HY519_01760, partial [Candidatus Aenigmarchaeota archaeon]|nr:hypothetical protein [Candidatus Aenigmarchaeota archaeon]
MESLLQAANIETKRAPFGWYKKFTIVAKGHPLAELSREIRLDKEAPKKPGSEKGSAQVLGRSKVTKEELGENDHRLLGQALDLYSFQEAAPGMVFFHPKGMVVTNQMLEFWRAEHVRRNYKEINTPLLMNRDLWVVSGHWDHYKEHMFFTSIDDADFALKPMNCPGAILVYKSMTRSYRDLPLRLAELGRVHRNELSGVLSGLFRLRAFTQDDAHLFVAESDLEKEIENVVEFINSIYKVFGFQYHVELSTRPEKHMGAEQLWAKAEQALETALKKKKISYKVNKGDGAFYGP